ncbi:hypothetical protein [Candidatus Phytoplasma bonamiae]|uniref:OTU domain-containing protein n=1 Tax=Candidatus Phytoplasma bonamiae TaxID=2982626 RepID=A0ABT9D4E3_9MOLU|nr:hypothetical protein ['Bonamia sp.' little leaf phytoplasma]MDO8064308.1 hypothetical protein ['Bonamia sp.' little leaf phytoplasma]MDV3174808.1 hypothetical protein ['Bonamia sp.' little leaf phytoplasma]
MLHTRSNNLKNILYILLFILHVIIIWFVYRCFITRKRKLYYCNHNYIEITNNDQYLGITNNNQYSENRQLVSKIAYLGWEQFILGLKDNNYKEAYENLVKWEKPSLNMNEIQEQIFNQTLDTAYPFLIQSTIDFLSKKINKKILLIIQMYNKFNKETFSHDFHSLYRRKDSSFIELKMKNFENQHFYIKEYNDTPGDGYCFFHALKKLLDHSEMPNWLDQINEDLQKTKLKFKASKSPN